MMSMTSAVDARIIDDEVAARFVNVIRDVLENPELLLSHRPPPPQADSTAARYDLEKLYAK